MSLVSKLIKEYLKEAPPTSSPEAVADRMGLTERERRQFLRACAKVQKQKKAPGRGRAPRMAAGKQNALEGRMDINRRGFGFMIPAGSSDSSSDSAEDVFIPPRRLRGAMHGDRVRIAVYRRKSTGKRWGEVLEILERVVERVVGRIRRAPASSGRRAGLHLVAYDAKIPPLRVEGTPKGAKPGSVAVGRIVRYPDPDSDRPAERDMTCRIEEILGQENAAGMDLKVTIRKYNLPEEFPEEVQAEIKKIPRNPRKKDLEGREDFRPLRIVTIDGPDARDFDDAVSIERTRKGNFLLGVHIADVAHYVTEGSAPDREARRRGTSVYFPEAVLPMFPEKISNDVCSLRPDVPRLTQSVLMEITKKGELASCRFADGVIESRARMVYEDVAGILSGNKRLRARYREHVADFEQMQELQQILYERRRVRGSLDFDLPEARVSLTAEGEIAGIFPQERTAAHRIIEEFMLAANEAVAEHLLRLRAPALYRVHEEPEPKKMDKLREFMRAMGVALPTRAGGVQPGDLQKVLTRFEGKPEERVVHHVILRSMMLARYSEKNLGHFGLAAPRYTHFTSPIRRYPDLVVHRALRLARRSKLTRDTSARSGSARRRKKTPLAPELAAIAESSSLAERRAENAERELIEWKKVRFMRDKIGKKFPALVSGATRHGLYVELKDYLIEGLVPKEVLPHDLYTLDEVRRTLRGRRKDRAWRLCDAVEVVATSVDEEHREIHFRLA
jgi:ribonuclease R